MAFPDGMVLSTGTPLVPELTFDLDARRRRRDPDRRGRRAAQPRRRGRPGLARPRDPGDADLRARRRRASRGGPTPEVAEATPAGAVPAGDRRAVARRAPGARRRRSRLVLGRRGRRHRDRLGPPADARSSTCRGGPAWARWWRGGAFDYARAATEPRAARDPDGEALVWEGEDGDGPAADERASSRRRSTPPRGGCGRTASGPGDRVGILLPMLVETVVAVLALGRLQAIYTPIFSGYGAPAIATRLADCEASMLITADGFLRRGSWVPLKAVADEAVAAAPSVRRVLVVRRAGDAIETPWTPGRDAWWDDAGRRRGRTRRSAARSIPRRRTCSSTPRARPAGRRAPSTSTAASRSRAPRTSPTSSTSGAATRCSGSPTSAG